MYPSEYDTIAWVMDRSDYPQLVEKLHLSYYQSVEDVRPIKILLYLRWYHIHNVPRLKVDNLAQ